MPFEWTHWMLTPSMCTHRIITSSKIRGSHHFGEKMYTYFIHSNEISLQIKLNKKLTGVRFQATNNQVHTCFMPKLVLLAN